MIGTHAQDFSNQIYIYKDRERACIRSDNRINRKNYILLHHEVKLHPFKYSYVDAEVLHFFTLCILSTHRYTGTATNVT